MTKGNKKKRSWTQEAWAVTVQGNMEQPCSLQRVVKPWNGMMAQNKVSANAKKSSPSLTLNFKVWNENISSWSFFCLSENEQKLLINLAEINLIWNAIRRDKLKLIYSIRFEYCYWAIYLRERMIYIHTHTHL